MTLPPTPEPPDPEAPRQNDPASGPGTPSSHGTLTHPDRRGAALHQVGSATPALLRGLLLALSVLGMLAAGALWLAGHPTLAARLLAGDVLLIFVVLLAL